MFEEMEMNQNIIIHLVKRHTCTHLLLINRVCTLTIKHFVFSILVGLHIGWIDCRDAFHAVLCLQCFVIG